MTWDIGTMIVAMVAAFAAITSSFIAMRSEKSLKILENKFKRETESNTFREKQLSELYFPMNIHLKVTKAIINNYFRTDQKTKRKNLAHFWRYHNNKMFDIIIKNSVYLDVDAPKEITDELLTYLLYWDVYYTNINKENENYGAFFIEVPYPNSKSIYFNKKTNSIGIEGYFKDKTESLRKQLFYRLSENKKTQNTANTE